MRRIITFFFYLTRNGTLHNVVTLDGTLVTLPSSSVDDSLNLTDVNDGFWHSQCWLFTPSHWELYIDGEQFHDGHMSGFEVGIRYSLGIKEP